ncbi:hypothetical protein BsWGS_27877 [Bradybaena similaris]
MDDALGRRDDVVDSSSVTRWNFTKLLEHPKEPSTDHESSPFPWRNDLNSKIALWYGDITKLNVHAITHSTNEQMNDRNPLSDHLYQEAGPDLYKEVQDKLATCRTGEVKLSKGYNLPARYVLHTVGPRYNTRYITAAEGALFSCYRNILQICRELEIRTIGLGAAHTLRRSYPPDKGAHIAIRTVRRFLEKFPETFDLIIFACNDENIEVYRQILPLYFPRDSSEEDEAFDSLPSDIGNEDGEPVIKERQIRIIDKPLSRGSEDVEQTVDLNKEFAQSMAADVGHHPFANMEEDPDKLKTTKMMQTAAIEQKNLEIRRRYESLLKKAKHDDLTDIASLHCLYRAGVDRIGRPIVVFVGRNYPAHTANPEKILLYLIRVMDSVVDSDYVVVYFHTQTTDQNHPAMAYLKMVYSLLDQRYKKNLKHFYIVHPTWWSKLATWFFTTFTASDLRRKVHNLRGVQFLFTKINPDQIDVPQFVQEHDIKINGARYVVPEPTSQDDL